MILLTALVAGFHLLVALLPVPSFELCHYCISQLTSNLWEIADGVYTVRATCRPGCYGSPAVQINHANRHVGRLSKLFFDAHLLNLCMWVTPFNLVPYRTNCPRNPSSEPYATSASLKFPT